MITDAPLSPDTGLPGRETNCTLARQLGWSTGRGSRPGSGHAQEATRECINEWNNKLFLSLKSIKKGERNCKHRKILRRLYPQGFSPPERQGFGGSGCFPLTFGSLCTSLILLSDCCGGKSPWPPWSVVIERVMREGRGSLRIVGR